MAFKPGQSEAAGGTFVTKEFAPTMQAQNNGSTAVPAVAFKPSHFTRGKDGKPDDVTPPLSDDADKGDQDTVIATSAVGFNWQNGGGYGNANDGLGITEEGTGPLQRRNTPAVAFQSTLGTRGGDVHATTDANKGSRRQEGVFAPAMQVRRLTPTECCRLQGFPDDHCDITFRKKPAADGPKYRALGNSMAVPCMLWLGWRIHKATV